MEKNEPIKSMDELAQCFGRRVRVHAVQFGDDKPNGRLSYKTHPNGEFFEGELRRWLDYYVIINYRRFNADGTELGLHEPSRQLIVVSGNDEELLAAAKVTLVENE